MSIDGTYTCVTKSPMGDQTSEFTIVTDGDTFTGVNAGFTVDMGPEATTTFYAKNWYVDGERLAEANRTVVVEPQGEAIQNVDIELVGAWNSSLDLVLNPVFQVCVDLIGCWDLVDMDIPIPLAGDDFEQFFPLQTLEFPPVNYLHTRR